MSNFFSQDSMRDTLSRRFGLTVTYTVDAALAVALGFLDVDVATRVDGAFRDFVRDVRFRGASSVPLVSMPLVR